MLLLAVDGTVYNMFLYALHPSIALFQDVTVLDYNMDDLTLLVPGESQPRALECRLLEANEESANQPMSEEQLSHIFVGSGRHGEVVSDAEDIVSDVEDLEENDEQIEAINIIPEGPQHPGDGDLGDALAEQEQLVAVVQEPDPIVALQTFMGQEQDLSDFIIDEELMYEAAPAHGHLPDPEPPLISSSAGCSSDRFEGQTVGLGRTSLAVRGMLPPRPTAKIQHKSPPAPTRCPGWQAWVQSDMPSRWFSYHSDCCEGKYASREQALHAAIEWLWQEHEKLG